MLSKWKQKIKEKFDGSLQLDSKESKNFIELLQKFHADHGISTKVNFSASDLLQEGGWFYVKTKNNIDMLVQMCIYHVEDRFVDYVWVEFDKIEPKVSIEVNYKDGSSKQYGLLSKEDILEFYP